MQKRTGNDETEVEAEGSGSFGPNHDFKEVTGKEGN
jgi:hypothetical protein